MDSFTTTTSQGFFQRVGGTIMAVILGPVFIIGAALLVFYNESHAVHAATSLREGAAVVVEAGADKVDPGLNGKLVHLTGKTKTDDPLRDPNFGVEFAGVKLARAVSFVVLFIGIRLIFGPISMLASIVPIFGALVGGGLFVISFFPGLPGDAVGAS